MPPFPAPESHVKLVAREWSKVQLGVLGFTGICGVLQSGGSSRPLWLQNASGIAAVVGLLVAVIAVGVVGIVAFPLGRGPMNPPAAARRVQLGIALTFVAVAFTALSSLSLRWPDKKGQGHSSAEKVIVRTISGAQCGTVIGDDSGLVDLDVNGTLLRLPLIRVVSIQQTDRC
jgi:hypothetical protein